MSETITLLKINSTGFKSGEYGGRKSSNAPVCNIAVGTW